MKLGVIGAASLGGAVGRAWAGFAGHDVMFASRHPDRLRVSGSRLTVADVVTCAMTAEVLLLATPYTALPDLGWRLNDRLAGRVVLDATNPERLSWRSGRDRPARGRGRDHPELFFQGAPLVGVQLYQRKLRDPKRHAAKGGGRQRATGRSRHRGRSVGRRNRLGIGARYRLRAGGDW